MNDTIGLYGLIFLITLLAVLLHLSFSSCKTELKKAKEEMLNVQFPTYNEVINNIAYANIMRLFHCVRWYGSIMNHYEIHRTFLELDGKEICLGDGKIMFDKLYSYFIEHQDTFKIEFSERELKIYRIKSNKYEPQGYN